MRRETRSHKSALYFGLHLPLLDILSSTSSQIVCLTGSIKTCPEKFHMSPIGLIHFDWWTKTECFTSTTPLLSWNSGLVKTTRLHYAFTSINIRKPMRSNYSVLTNHRNKCRALIATCNQLIKRTRSTHIIKVCNKCKCTWLSLSCCSIPQPKNPRWSRIWESWKCSPSQLSLVLSLTVKCKSNITPLCSQVPKP